MKKFILAVLALSLPASAFAGIKWYSYPMNVSEDCAVKVIAAIESDPVLSGYVGENDTASMEWWDETETELDVTVQGQDWVEGYLVARYEVTKLPQGDCTVGKLVSWDVAH